MDASELFLREIVENAEVRELFELAVRAMGSSALTTPGVPIEEVRAADRQAGESIKRLARFISQTAATKLAMSVLEHASKDKVADELRRRTWAHVSRELRII